MYMHTCRQTPAMHYSTALLLLAGAEGRKANEQRNHRQINLERSIIQMRPNRETSIRLFAVSATDWVSVCACVCKVLRRAIPMHNASNEPTPLQYIHTVFLALFFVRSVRIGALLPQSFSHYKTTVCSYTPSSPYIFPDTHGCKLYRIKRMRFLAAFSFPIRFGAFFGRKICMLFSLSIASKRDPL